MSILGVNFLLEGQDRQSANLYSFVKPELSQLTESQTNAEAEMVDTGLDWTEVKRRGRVPSKARNLIIYDGI